MLLVDISIEGELTMSFADDLFGEGVFAQGIGYPTVPEPKSRVRTIVTATHSKEQLQYALTVMERVAKRQGIL